MQKNGLETATNSSEINSINCNTAGQTFPRNLIFAMFAVFAAYAVFMHSDLPNDRKLNQS